MREAHGEAELRGTGVDRNDNRHGARKFVRRGSREHRRGDEDIGLVTQQLRRKAPYTQKAGPGYVDPEDELSTEWIDTKQRLDATHLHWSDQATSSRVQLICGSARNDGTCPGEMSKSFRLLGFAREALERAGIQANARARRPPRRKSWRAAAVLAFIAWREQRRVVELMGKLEWDESFNYKAGRSRS